MKPFSRCFFCCALLLGFDSCRPSAQPPPSEPAATTLPTAAPANLSPIATPAETPAATSPASNPEDLFRRAEETERKADLSDPAAVDRAIAAWQSFLDSAKGRGRRSETVSGHRRLGREKTTRNRGDREERAQDRLARNRLGDLKSIRHRLASGADLGGVDRLRRRIDAEFARLDRIERLGARFAARALGSGYLEREERAFYLSALTRKCGFADYRRDLEKLRAETDRMLSSASSRPPSTLETADARFDQARARVEARGLSELENLITASLRD